MIEAITKWYAALSMEQVFVVTGIFILLLGAGLGFLFEWIFRKENERDGEDV